MTLTEHYERLLAYDEWANREEIRVLRSTGTVVPLRAVAIMAHIIATQRVWFERINDPALKPPVWPEWKLEQTEAEMSKVLVNWRGVLLEERLREPVEYSNTKGERWINTVSDVFQHVMFHGAYHRGQIATLLRQAGATPAYTDYIEAVRREHL